MAATSLFSRVESSGLIAEGVDVMNAGYHT